MQLPNSVQADQFQAYPAIDIRALSIASSLRLSPQRNRAFLEQISVIRGHSEWVVKSVQEKKPWICGIFYLLQQF